MKPIADLARSPFVRATVGVLAIGLITLLIRRIGAVEVYAALERSAGYFPIVVLLESCVVSLDMLSLRLLYGEDRHRLPVAAVVRAGLVGYPVTCLVPMGRVVAEAARAMLARYTSTARASAAAARLQGILLLANAAISVPCALVVFGMLGFSLLPAAILGNCLLTLTLGTGILYAGRHAGVGAWLARRTQRASSFGPAFDELLRGEPALPLPSLLLSTASRGVQVFQHGILVLAVGGVLGVRQAFSAEGIHLVGAALGDLFPAGLGATEANFTYFARLLSLTPGDAISIAILGHMAQIVWVSIGLTIPLIWSPVNPVGPTVLNGPTHTDSALS